VIRAMIPLFKPHVGDAERAAILRVLARGVLSRGPEVRAFEEEFAAFVDRRHAVAVASGTAALHLAVIAIGWGPGARVLTAALGYIATANALLFKGVTPVFVDADSDTLNLCFRKIDGRDAGTACGLLLTHFLGLPADPDGARRLREHAGLEVIEDASQAVGTPSPRFPVGRYGRAAVYSFQENKPLTTGGEGGMITTDDGSLADECRALRDQGRRAGSDWLAHVPLGYSYRLTELQAAIGRAQLRKLPAMLTRRAEIASQYGQLLAEEEGMEPLAKPVGLERSWFMYFVRCATRELRDRAERTLSAADIETRRLLPSIPSFPAYRHLGTQQFPEALAAYDTCLALPLHAGMSAPAVVEVADALRLARPRALWAARRARV
jgi:perosamine synthetase